MRARYPDDPDLGAVLDALHQAAEVDASRIEVTSRAGAVVLRGSVSTQEETFSAVLIAEQALDGAAPIVDELQVDPNLREGVIRPMPSEPATPAADEVLIGDPDMLSGTEVTMTDDPAIAIEDSEPWAPPDLPQMPNGARPQAGLDTGEADAPEGLRVEDDQPAAPDLTAKDLRSDRLPSLDPEAAAGSPDPPPTPAKPPLDVETPPATPMPDFVKGDGATGEATVGGGSAGGTPAPEPEDRGAESDR